VIAQLNTTTCVWNGLTLKTETNMMGMSMTKVATKIEENVAVDEALFAVPEGITVRDAPFGAGAMPGAMSGAQGGSQDAATPEMPAGATLPEGIKLPEGVKLPPGMMPPAASGADQ
jgi:hypothetical protein